MASNFKFINKVPFEYGISLNGQTPLDDRCVLTQLSDLYCTANNTSSALYARAYEGMMIAIKSGSAYDIYVLNDSTPYTPGKNTITINASNVYTYWTKIGKALRDFVEGTVNPSVNALEGYVAATNISDAGGTTITPTAGTTGKTYTVAVNKDNDTIKLVNNKLTGGKYKIVKQSTPTANMFASYKLSYKAPDSTNYVDLSGDTIDIPKDYVLKEVHLCKAKYDSASQKYTETSKAGAASWATDTNGVYMHFIWHTSDANPLTSETYLRVADVIATDIVTINASINTLESNLSKVSNTVIAAINSSITGLKTKDVEIDASITALKAKDVNIDASITGLKAKDASIDSSITALTTRLSEVSNSVIASLNSSISAVNSSTSSAISTLRTDIANASTAAATALATLNTSVGNAISALNTSTSSAISTLNTTVNTTITNNINGLNSSLNAVNSSTFNAITVLDSSITQTIADWQVVEQNWAWIFNMFVKCAKDATDYAGFKQNLTNMGL